MISANEKNAVENNRLIITEVKVKLLITFLSYRIDITNIHYLEFYNRHLQLAGVKYR